MKLNLSKFYFVICLFVISSHPLLVQASAVLTQTPVLNQEQKQFLGTWGLVENVRTTPNGNEYPYGKNAIGYITYTKNGFMSVQMMRTQDFNSTDNNYFAYFGKYEIDTKHKIVHHYVEGSLNTKDVSTDRQRKYEFIGNKLYLTAMEDPNRKIIWEKKQ